MKLQRLFAVFSLLAILATGCGLSVGHTKKENPPNIVFILTDDMDMPLLDYMPKTKELIGKQGVTFDEFFISMATCCPSRSTILRGQYSHNTQIFETELPDGGFEKFYALKEEKSTIAVWLQDAGYKTALFGKYLNGYPNTAKQTYVPNGWTEWYSPADGDPYTEFNYTLNENGKLVKYGDTPEDYGTDVYAAKAIDFIQRSVKSGDPFFAHISVYAPHSPYVPAPRHANLFTDLTMSQSPSFNEEDNSDKPWMYSEEPPLSSDNLAKMKKIYPKRIQSMQAVDEMVENVVKTLDSLDALDNTYIFFTSDNGFHMGEHRLLPGKNTAFEEDIHVPLLVRGPKIPAGSTVNALAGNVDFASTFADIAGIDVPNFVDGRSLLPLLTGSTPDGWRQAFLLERGLLDEAAYTPDVFVSAGYMTGLREPLDSPYKSKLDRAYRGLRTQNYAFVRYGDNTLELYNLKNDPHQLDNIAGSTSPDLLNQLQNWLESLRHCTGASCREIEAQPCPNLGQ
jgi:N-acetylglucosamine-6-sulfatase